MIPSATARRRSPRLVSSVIAVVMVRVWPAMLPPTISTAPTSALARPKPASMPVMRLKRPSQSSVGTARSRDEPSERSCSAYSAQRSSMTLRVSDSTIGRISTNCASTIAGGREEQPERAEAARERDSSR